ncbi:MAG TPA: hypothetical protein VF885_04980 [Arthrobacter sp.]
MTNDQPRDNLGQFASTAHAEAPNVSLGFDRGDTTPAAEMSPEKARGWIAGQALHHLSPVIGWIHLDAADGQDTTVHNKSFEERIERLADDVAERFAVPGAVAVEQRLSQEESAYAAVREIRHHIAPVIGELRQNAKNGIPDADRRLFNDWRESADRAAAAIAEQFTAPAPVLDGFTAAEVEDHLAREQHERQCACDLVDDICYTESYGEHWRHRMGVPDVEGIFDTIKEMAAARDAGKQTT